MNFPNFLTCSRVVMAVFFSICLFSPEPFGKLWALFYFVLASLTDYWDGVIARRMHTESRFGKLMDPIADKLLTVSAFVNFWVLRLVPGWMVAVILVRDATVTLARFFVEGQKGREGARVRGKQKTFLQIVFIIGVLLYLIAREQNGWNVAYDVRALRIIYFGMLAVVIMTLWSGLDVLRAGGNK